MAQIPLDRIHLVAQAYFQERLNKALELSIDLPSDNNIDLEFEIQGSVERIAVLRTMLAKRKYDQIVEIDAKEILGKVGGDNLVDDALTYTKQLVARAMILQNEYLVQHLSGSSYNGAPDDAVFKNIQPNALPEWSDSQSAFANNLGSAIDKYMDLKASVWARKTKADQKRCLYLMRDIIGENALMATIKTEDMRKVRDTLMRMPANAFKARSSNGKSLEEVIKDNQNSATLSFKTTDKYFTMIRSFFNWAKDEELISDVPGAKIKMMGAPKETAIEERLPYTDEELLNILNSPLYAGCKSPGRRNLPGTLMIYDDKYWIPLVGLYSGMRLGEIVQLRVDDFKSEEGIAYFDVCLDEDDDKTVKTLPSIRRVPVHPILISLGLLSYVAERRKNKRKRIFDDIKPSADNYYSANFSKFWSRYTGIIKIKTKKNSFHSFRHNFADAMREAEVAEDVSRQLTGHTDNAAKTDSHLRYGTKARLKRVHEGICKVSYGTIDQMLLSN
ncbi:site-specific integrase [Brucella sp. H1_1004]|uniref:site-specific integrase n=1 Tax=Brucella sp. H1_1004 TaxID=3110109 RepID=UPI0039B684F7